MINTTVTAALVGVGGRHRKVCSVVNAKLMVVWESHCVTRFLITEQPHLMGAPCKITHDKQDTVTWG